MDRRTLPMTRKEDLPARDENVRAGWVVRVTSFYLTAKGWIVGDPSKAKIHDTELSAQTEADRVRDRRLWLGTVSIQYLEDLRPPQW